jgi:hypothetical protein
MKTEKFITRYDRETRPRPRSRRPPAEKAGPSCRPRPVYNANSTSEMDCRAVDSRGVCNPLPARGLRYRIEIDLRALYLHLQFPPTFRIQNKHHPKTLTPHATATPQRLAHAQPNTPRRAHRHHASPDHRRTQHRKALPPSSRHSPALHALRAPLPDTASTVQHCTPPLSLTANSQARHPSFLPLVPRLPRPAHS